MIKSHFRGHPIVYKNGEWVYEDNGESTRYVDDEGRPVKPGRRKWCGHCGLPDTPEEHDGCIPNLRGVKNACCGHGQTNEAYIQFWDSREDVRGRDAIEMFDSLRT